MHTNFKLGASGEYLALVMPDGVTRATEFSPAFPQQYPDVAYGFPMTGIVTTISAPASSVRALVPSGNIGAAWRSNSFNDASWLSGNLGVGFDATSNYSSAIGLDVKTPMLNVNPSASLRVPFSATNPATFQALTLSMRYDDGFVAWLNEYEVLRRNAPAHRMEFNGYEHARGAGGGTLTENFEGAGTQYTLTTYGATPAPAVQPAGTTTGSYLRLLYDGVNGAANSISFARMFPACFKQSLAILIFASIPRSRTPRTVSRSCSFPLPFTARTARGLTLLRSSRRAKLSRRVRNRLRRLPHSSVNDVSAPWSGAEAVNVTMPTSTIDLASGVFHHAKITLTYVTGGARVTVTLTKNINGTRALPLSHHNFFIAGMNPFDCRVQFGGRTGGLNLALDLDNINVQFQPPQGTIAFEDFDITPSLICSSPARICSRSRVWMSPRPARIFWFSRNCSQKISPSPVRQRTVPRYSRHLEQQRLGTANSRRELLPRAGVYQSNSLGITLSSSSSSAIIHYTLDGSTPTTNSPIFTNTIVLTANTTIRAQATDPSGIVGQVAAANYVLLDSTVTNFTSNLPLIIVDTLGQAIPDGSKVGSYCIFVDTNTPTGRVSLGSPPDYIGRLGIGLHGSSFARLSQQNLAIELEMKPATR